MKLIDTFQDEHVLIDQVLGSFRTYVVSVRASHS
jgi:hypothetical protein